MATAKAAVVAVTTTVVAAVARPHWSITGSQGGSPANVRAQGFVSELEENSETLRLSPKSYSDLLGALASTSEGQEDLVFSWSHNCYQARNDLKKFSEGGDMGRSTRKPQTTIPTIHQATGGSGPTLTATTSKRWPTSTA